MKKRLTTLIGAVALTFTLPAFAGPDWQVIEQARHDKSAQSARMEKLTPEEKCVAKRTVLPLDHGPHAQTTPYLNEKSKVALEADLRACKVAAAKG